MIIGKIIFYIRMFLFGNMRKRFNFLRNYLPPNSTSIIKIDANKQYVTKHVIRYIKYNVVENEVKWLKKLEKSGCTPNFISRKDYIITMSYSGENLTKDNIPADWRKQINQIISTLKEFNCSHNDIKPTDLLVLNNNIILIDFQWATTLEESIPSNWPNCIGRNYKITKEKFDDKRSLDKSIQDIINFS